MYLRFLQFSVFNPFLRLHSTKDLVLTKKPWEYKNGIGELSRETMRLRHRMIPLLHTANYRKNRAGIGLIEPMYYLYPPEKESYECTVQYIFAENLMVAPITERGDFSKLSEMAVWLPEVKWTDIFTGDIYDVQKNRFVTMVRALDSIPVLAKSGAVLPFSLDNDNKCENPDKLLLEVYLGKNSYTLYENNGKLVANEGSFPIRDKRLKDATNAKTVEMVKNVVMLSILPHREMLRLVEHICD